MCNQVKEIDEELFKDPLGDLSIVVDDRKFVSHSDYNCKARESTLVPDLLTLDLPGNLLLPLKGHFLACP